MKNSEIFASLEKMMNIKKNQDLTGLHEDNYTKALELLNQSKIREQISEMPHVEPESEVLLAIFEQRKLLLRTTILGLEFELKEAENKYIDNLKNIDDLRYKIKFNSKG